MDLFYITWKGTTLYLLIMNHDSVLGKQFCKDTSTICKMELAGMEVGNGEMREQSGGTRQRD